MCEFVCDRLIDHTHMTKYPGMGRCQKQSEAGVQNRVAFGHIREDE